MICFQEVETKYNELRRTHSDQAAADSDDNNNGVFSLLTADILTSESNLLYIFV